MEEEKTIHAFGVAWGTNVSSLKKRIKDGTYRVMYTNDPQKWAKVSHASQGGKEGLSNYNKPQGWTEAYTQNVNNLPDANGNKVFIRSLDKPIKARYVMVTGEIASRTIEIYNFFVFQRQLVDGVIEKPVYPTFNPVNIQPDYEGMSIMPGRQPSLNKGPMYLPII